MTVVLYGSPNKDGHTKKELGKILGEYTLIDAYNLDIDPCIDCKWCSHKPGCKFKDMGEVYELIKKTDKLVIASPLYFGALTPKLLNIISRLQTFYANKYYRSQKNPVIHETLLIVTAGGDYENMFDGVIQTYKLINDLFECKKTDMILVKNTDNQ